MRAFAFGFTVAAAFGPIALLLIHTGMARGLAGALPAATGVAVADFAYSLIAFAGGSSIAAALHAERLVVGIAGSGILIAVGLWMLWGSLAKTPEAGGQRSNRSAAGFMETFLLTLANPLTILLFVGFCGQLPLSMRWSQAAYFSAFIFLGSLPVQIGYALLGSALRTPVRDGPLANAVNQASSAGILLFGAYGVLRALYGM